MSEAYQSLRRQTRELTSLLQDIQRSEWPVVPLHDSVEARQSLGNEVKVSRWVLIEYFLSIFVEWNDLYTRYLDYFGRAEEDLPTRWRNLRLECDQFRQRALFHSAYEGLPTTLAQDWLNGDDGQVVAQNGPVAAEELYHKLVQFDLQVRTASIHSWESLGPWDHLNAITFPSGPDPGWQNLAADLSGQGQGLVGRFEEVDQETQNAVRQFVRNYRHATLRMSWLEQNGNGATSVLFSIDEPVEEKLDALQHVLHDLMGQVIPDDFHQTAHQVLGRIVEAVHEIGYANFVKDVTSKDFVGGSDSPLGASEINIIPGNGPSACRPILVAISRGASRRGKVGFPNILQQVKSHLIDCTEITRIVIFLCDTWDARHFMHEHYEELRAHHRSGVRFLFLMTGAPNTSLTAVDVKF